MVTAYYTGRVYKVVNNVETYFATMKFYFPFDDSFISNSSSSQLLASLALEQCDLNVGYTYFYLSGRSANTNTRLFTPSNVLGSYGKLIDLTFFENSILRVKIDEHRRIDYIIPSITKNESSFNGGTWSLNNIHAYFYYDNVMVLNCDNGTINNDYQNSAFVHTATYNARLAVFPLPNGNYYSHIFAKASQRYDDRYDPEDPTYQVQTFKIPGNLTSWLNGFEPQEYDEGNPYIEGGTSEEGGGDGNFSEDSDDVDTDQLPVIDAVGTGFATLFTPSKSQLKALADVMWDSNIFTALQNLVENITGMFTSLAIVPFQVTAGNTVEVTWLGLPITELFLTLASKQYYEFDMGSINMKNDNRIFTSGSALDYSPFSSLGIFLPFIGFQELDIDECRNSVINLKYRIDILSGTCVALISLNGNTVYQFTGNCLSQIPITNENMQSLVTDAVQVGIAAAATHSAKSAVGAAEASMGEAETAKETKAAKAALGHAEAHLAQTKAGLASATANASMGMKPVYGKAGAISASASLLAVKQPYLFLRTPRQSIPDHYQRYCGFPSNMSGKLSSFSGYTVVEDIRLNGLVATSPEVVEIYELLKGGVII